MFMKVEVVTLFVGGTLSRWRVLRALMSCMKVDGVRKAEMLSWLKFCMSMSCMKSKARNGRIECVCS